MHIKKHALILLLALLLLVIMTNNASSAPSWIKPKTQITVTVNKQGEKYFCTLEILEISGNKIKLETIYNNKNKYLDEFTIDYFLNKYLYVSKLNLYFGQLKLGQVKSIGRGAALLLQGPKKVYYVEYTIWLKVVGKTTYNGRPVWKLALTSYKLEKKYPASSPNSQWVCIWTCSNSKATFIVKEHHTFGGKTHIFYYGYVEEKFDEFTLLVDIETGLLLYAKIVSSGKYYSGPGYKSLSELHLDSSWEYRPLEIKVTLKTPDFYGDIRFTLDKDLDYSKGSFITVPLSSKEIKIIHLDSKKEKVIKLNKDGIVNASELLIKSGKGFLEGKYKITIEEKSTSYVKYYWYYKTWDYFPPATIWYTVSKEKSSSGKYFYRIKVLRTYNARVYTYSSSIFEKSPLDITEGATIKLRTIDAWDKLIRYTIYKFLLDAGVDSRVATTIRNIPLYYGTGQCHYTTVYWQQIKLEHDASTTYSFWSDKGLVGDLEGIFHEYGHAVRENVWPDPSLYFRWRKLGGKHGSTYAPCSSEFVAFDEGHSWFFASLVLKYIKSKMASLYDIPLPKVEMYSGNIYKGSKYRGELVEGRIAGYLLNLLSSDPTKAYSQFLAVVDASKVLPNHVVRTIIEWNTLAYKHYPDLRGKIVELCNQYNIKHFFSSSKTKGSVSGKYIVIIVRSKGEYIRDGKKTPLEQSQIYGAVIHEGDKLTLNHWSMVCFEKVKLFSIHQSQIEFSRNEIKVVKGRILVQTTGHPSWLIIRAGSSYRICDFKSKVLVEVDGGKVTISIYEGSVRVKTPNKEIVLSKGQQLLAQGSKYNIKNFKVSEANLAQTPSVKLTVSPSKTVFGEKVGVKVSTNVLDYRLVVLAYNKELEEGFILLNSTTYSKTTSISTDKLPAGNYTVVAVVEIPDTITGYESNTVALTISRSKPSVTITLEKTSVKKGEELVVSGNITRYYGELFINMTSPTGRILSKKIEVTGKSFTTTVKLDETGKWTIVAVVPETRNNYAASSNTVTVEVQEDYTPYYIAAALALAAAAGATVFLLKRRKKLPPPPPPPPIPPAP